MATSGKTPRVTIEELEEQYKLSPSSLDQRCTREHALHMATHLTTWERVATRLGLEEPDIEAIKRDRDNEEGKREAALLKWKQLFSYKATNRKLIQALLDVGRADLAEDMCNLISESPLQVPEPQLQSSHTISPRPQLTHQQENLTATKEDVQVKEDWEVTIEGERRYAAVGFREVLIIVSSVSNQGPDIVPRRDVELTKEDLDRLQKINLPRLAEHEDTSIMMARYEKDKSRDVVGVTRSKPGDRLFRDSILKRIEMLMVNSRKRGAIICYFGPGKRNTGDWCFEDGFVTFRDIAELYCKHFKGRVLGIHTDCAYSGNWVNELVKFLEEMTVKPCGHSAREKEMLIKVYASCKRMEIPYRLLYSLRANENDKNTGAALTKYSGFEVAEEQHIHWFDPTSVRCDARSFEEPCTFSPEHTWERWSTKDRGKS